MIKDIFENRFFVLALPALFSMLVFLPASHLFGQTESKLVIQTDENGGAAFLANQEKNQKITLSPGNGARKFDDFSILWLLSRQQNAAPAVTTLTGAASFSSPGSTSNYNTNHTTLDSPPPPIIDQENAVRSFENNASNKEPAVSNSPGQIVPSPVPTNTLNSLQSENNSANETGGSPSTQNDNESGGTTSPTVFVQQNAPPQVSAGNDLTVTMPTAAVLNGQVTDDGLPSGMINTIWSKTSGPGNVQLADALLLDTTALFSEVGDYVLRLTGSDGSLSSFDEITIHVSPVPNQPPVAEAGSDQTAGAGVQVILDGSGSYDPDGSALTYQWSQAEGPAINLIDGDHATARFLAPSSGHFVFKLTVTDTINTSSEDTTAVDVVSGFANQNPVIAQGDNLDLTVPENSSADDPTNQFLLSATDNEGSLLTWTFSLFPLHGNVQFENGSSTITSDSGESIGARYAPMAGYIGDDSVVAQVSDDQGGTDQIVIKVTVQDPQATVLYVDDDGPMQPGYDLNQPEGTIYHPYSSLAAAVTAIPSGSTLYVNSGNYVWTTGIQTLNKQIDFIGSTDSKPHIQLDTFVLLTAEASGSSFSNLILWSADGLSCFLMIENGEKVDDILIDNISFRGYEAIRATEATGSVIHENWVVRNSIFVGTANVIGTLLSFGRHRNLDIERNTFLNENDAFDNLVKALSIASPSNGNAFVRGNVFATAGINALTIGRFYEGDSNGHVYVVNNTFYDTKASGVYPFMGALNDGCADETVVNNLFVSNGRYAILTFDDTNSPCSAQVGGSIVDYNYFHNNNGTSYAPWDDVSMPTDSRYSPDSFTHQITDINPTFLSETYGTLGFLRFHAASPAASGAFNSTIPDYPFPVYAHNGEAYFGALEPVDD